VQWGRHKGLDGRYGKHVEPLPQWGNRWGRPCGSGTFTRLSPSSSSVRKCNEYPVNFHHNQRVLGQSLQARDLVGAQDQMTATTPAIQSKLARSFGRSAVRSWGSARTSPATPKRSRRSPLPPFNEPLALKSRNRTDSVCRIEKFKDEIG
jgi:hypothetical protein